MTALMSEVCYREAEPFLEAYSNAYVYAAKLSKILAFGSQLSLDINQSEGINPIVFELGLCMANCNAVLLAIGMVSRKHIAERKKQQKTDVCREI